MKPLSTQVSFVINTVRGYHTGEQGVVVSVNGHNFSLVPRTIQKRFRFYDAGYTLFLEYGGDINISVGIVTPVSKREAYLHCMARHKVKSSRESITQSVTLMPIGKTYSIDMTLFIGPSYIYDPEKSPQKINRKPKPAEENEIENDYNLEEEDLMLCEESVGSTSILDPDSDGADVM